ncbi:RDD family protein [Exiguobacterium alkaliphilum]|uniref:RDD family protein n=1 Tax=Exiguobacterium alkaliphilum TaxID=1428684 RepID=A0ABT2L0H9_9BACL|nr:RDD family protein [Exiguobacterium alkaliphilum]MCT4795774.1 RDD family protein [Exiguobacterium alkaliphilum]
MNVAVPIWKRAVASQIDQLIFQTPAKLIEKSIRKAIWPKKEVKRYYLPTLVTITGEVYFLLNRNGQTIGDQVVGIKVVSQDGRPLSLEQVVKRTLYKDVVYPATLGLPLLRALQQMKSNKDVELPHDEFAHTKLISTK